MDLTIRSTAGIAAPRGPLTGLIGAVVALSCSCSFDTSIPAVPVDAAQPVPDAGGPDIDAGGPSIDAGDPGIDAPGCSGWAYNPLHFDPCTVVQPAGNLILAAGTYTYNTDTGTLTGIGTDPPTELLALNPEVRLIAVDRLDIQSGATLRVVGSRPLLIAAWQQSVVSGTIDVSSSLGAPGAGSNPTACNSHAPEAGTQGNDGGGGGGGGGFGGDGGDGGDGGSGGIKGAKGTKVPTPNNIRGGCDGAAGGMGDRNDGGGNGGPGGGAIYLAANNSITVNGLVQASGAGGEGADGEIGGGGATRRSGGGGGGSGGYIALEAPTVTAASGAFIIANGGGGGGGCDHNAADDGEDPTDDGAQASGGASEGSNSGDGGDGGFAGQPDADRGGSNSGGNEVGGGGGGGGGGGHIIVHSPNFTSNAAFSPAPQTNP